MRFAGVAVLLAFGLAGCTKHIATPRPAKPGASDASAAWARVLERHVNDVGQIDFAAIRTEPEDLETYVAWAAKNGPRSTPEAFPTREAKLAYYLNTYNATCMYNALVNTRRPRQVFLFFLMTKLPIDGEETSLYALENQVIRAEFKEPRVHFILNCMVKGCPRLPREPMKPESLGEQLESAAKLFFNEPRNVQVVDAEKKVRLSSILKFYTEDFLQPNTEAKTLIEYANRYRESKIPEGYEVEFIDYDWTLNQTPVTTSDAAKR